MPFSVVEYSALAGKTRGMYGKLLSNEDYMELMGQKSVCDVASFLKNNTHYSEALSGWNECEIHRGHLENILRKSLMEDFRKLFSFTHGNVKEFLKIVYLRYEVESFKHLFRVLEREGTTDLAEDSLLFLNKYDTLNIGKLAKSGNSQIFISNLKGTEYYQVLRPFLTGDEHHNLFHIEMSLDMYYVNLFLKKRKSLLTGVNAKVVDYSIGTEVEVLNLLWIYRGRMVYNLDRSVILGHLIPHRYKLSREFIYELVDVKSPDYFKKLVSQTKYADLFLSDSHSFFELNFSEYMYRVHRSFLRKYGFSIASALSYVNLKQYEISNIISIIEGIRYNLPMESIRKYVVGITGNSA